MADLPPSAFTGVFHRPFAEQVAFFRAKLGNLVPTAFWDDLKKAEHDRAFMVAGAAKADLLQDLAAAVDKVISEGTGIDAFRKDFFAIAQRHGWTNYTGSGSAGGRDWRTRVIYTTNAQTSYAAGRLAQLRAANFKLWVYKHSDGEMHPRPIHESWDGLVLPPDHPFWKQHYPPSGWGCRCYVLGARGDVSARAMGGDPGKQLPEGWETIDPKTGEPLGIDKGWGYMPGDTVSDAVTETAAKVQDWGYDIAKAFMDELPTETRDAFATSYRSLPSTADDARRYARRILGGGNPANIPPARTLGLAASKQVKAIDALRPGASVNGYDFALTPEGVHRAAASGILSPDDYALLPAILNAPDATISQDTHASGLKTGLVRIRAVLKGEAYVTVWRILADRAMLVLQRFSKGTDTP